MKRSQWALVILILLVPMILAAYLLFQINIPLPYLMVSWLVFFAILTNLEKATSLGASLFKVFSGVWFYAESKAVKLRIESTIGPAAKKVNNEGIELLPHGIRINWAEPKDRDAFLKDGHVVVCLESSKNEDRNLARATKLFVSHDLIQDSQRFVEPSIMESAILTIARKMLMIDKRIDALKCLGQEFINPAIEADQEIGKYISAMEFVDAQGRLTRVLLREFSYLGARLGPKVSDPKAIADTRAFADLVTTFEMSTPEEEVPLDYYGNVIRASLLIVARHDKSFSTEPFQKRVVKAHKRKIDTIYVLARGQNEWFADLVVKRAVESGLYQEQQKWSFKVTHKERKVKSFVAVLARTNP